MSISDLVKSSLESLVRTKARSGLTMLGIVIGIMAVILMLSIGEAAQRYILAQVSAFGSDVIFVVNGPKEQEGQPSLFVQESLTYKDMRKLRSLPWVSMVVGAVTQSEQVIVGSYDAKLSLIGTTPDEIRFNDRKLLKGNFFEWTDVDEGARVVVLGYDVADGAFGQEDPIGKSIKLGGQSFRVVGVMQKAGTVAYQNVDKQVYIPVTAAINLFNKKYLSRIQVKPTVSVEAARIRLEDQLRDLHNIDNPTGIPSKDDFHITTQKDAMESASQITGILQILLTSIAAISLIVGGIGIMNIMYVSVTERIKEIGLRKAIGAQQGDILGQFLVEAVLLTTLGGIIGIALGISLAWLAIQIISSFQSGWTFAVSTRGVGLGLVVSAAIGIVFGYFPARRAAKLHPIEALRFE